MNYISKLMKTLRQAQKELHANWITLTKLITKLNLKPIRVGKFVLLTDKDFQILKKAHTKISKKRKSKKRKS